jgi:predicted dehydrogenase
MPGPLRLAVVGAGHFGRYHVLKAAAEPRVALVGVVDHDPAKAARVAAEGGARGLPDLDAALAAAEAVVVAASTRAHHEIGLRVLEAGRHLFVEKPIATTLAEADELIGQAAARGLVLQVGHLERFSVARSALARHVGRPVAMEFARLAPYRPRGTDVSVVLDLMIHDIDLLLTLVKEGARDVAAVGIPVLTPFVDIANARLTFQSGAVANVTASRVSRERMRKLRIFQPSGYLSLDLAAGTGEFYRMRGDVDLAALTKSPQPLEAFVERVALEAPEGEPLRLEFRSFIDAVRGAAPVAVSGEDGREALAVALRIVAEIERTRPALASGVERARA